MVSRLWPPVTVRVGANEIINQKVMKHEPSDTFNDFLTKIRMCSECKGWLAFSSVRTKNC